MVWISENDKKPQMSIELIPQLWSFLSIVILPQSPNIPDFVQCDLG